MADKVIKPDELMNGLQGEYITLEISLPKGKYKRGEALGAKADGTKAKIDGTTITVDKFDCICTEDIELKAAGKTTAYFQGVFNKNSIITEAGVTVDTLVEHGRKLGIYIK